MNSCFRLLHNSNTIIDYTYITCCYLIIIFRQFHILSKRYALILHFLLHKKVLIFCAFKLRTDCHGHSLHSLLEQSLLPTPLGTEPHKQMILELRLEVPPPDQKGTFIH